MLQPVRRRTWAPAGQTPVQHAFDRHDRLSVMSAITVSPQRRRLGHYFSLWPHNITAEEVILFLKQMHAYFGRPTIIVWDRWQVHRSAAAYFEKHHPDWFLFEWLPAYAPDLNPVEASWSHTKYGELANFIPDDVAQLQDAVTASLEAKRTHQQLLRSFFKCSRLVL
jgi:transposase